MGRGKVALNGWWPSPSTPHAPSRSPAGRHSLADIGRWVSQRSGRQRSQPGPALTLMAQRDRGRPRHVRQLTHVAAIARRAGRGATAFAERRSDRVACQRSVMPMRACSVGRILVRRSACSFAAGAIASKATWRRIVATSQRQLSPGNRTRRAGMSVEIMQGIPDAPLFPGAWRGRRGEAQRRWKSPAWVSCSARALMPSSMRRSVTKELGSDSASQEALGAAPVKGVADQGS
jgi:hypothetical protein